MIFRVFLFLFLFVSISVNASSDKILDLLIVGNCIMISLPDENVNNGFMQSVSAETSFTMIDEGEGVQKKIPIAPLYDYLRDNRSYLFLNIEDDGLVLRTNNKEVRVLLLRNDFDSDGKLALSDDLLSLMDSPANDIETMKDKLFFKVLLPNNQEKLVAALEGDSTPDSDFIDLSCDCFTKDTEISSGAALITLVERKGTKFSFLFRESPPPSYDEIFQLDEGGESPRASDSNAQESSHVVMARSRCGWGGGETSQSTITQSRRKSNRLCIAISVGVVLGIIIIVFLYTEY